MSEPYDPLSYGMLPKGNSSVEPTEESHAEDILFGDEPPPESASSENVEELMSAAAEEGDWDPVEDSEFGGGAASLATESSVSDLDLADAGIETEPLPTSSAPPPPTPEPEQPPAPAAIQPPPAPAPSPAPRDPSIAPAPRMRMEPAPRRLPTRKTEIEAPSEAASGVDCEFKVHKRRTGLALGVAGGIAVSATAFAAWQVAAGSLAVGVFAGLVGAIGAALAWVSVR